MAYPDCIGTAQADIIKQPVFHGEQQAVIVFHLIPLFVTFSRTFDKIPDPLKKG
jgi:hypothetical protein